MADNQWHVKQDTGNGQTRTLHSGSEKTARRYVRDNFPRPHVVFGQDNVQSEATLHGPGGEKFAYHGEDAVGADDDGWVNLNSTSDEPDDDEPDDDNPPAFTEGATL